MSNERRTKKHTESAMIDLDKARQEYAERRQELVRMRERWIEEIREYSEFLRGRAEKDGGEEAGG